MIQRHKSIQLVEQNEYHKKYRKYFIEKYDMTHSLGPKIIYRMTTNEHSSFPSDNYMDEYLINEHLLGIVYFRRNEYNLCEVIMIDLETDIPNEWYNDKIHEIEVNNEVF